MGRGVVGAGCPGCGSLRRQLQQLRFHFIRELIAPSGDLVDEFVDEFVDDPSADLELQRYPPGCERRRR